MFDCNSRCLDCCNECGLAYLEVTSQAMQSKLLLSRLRKLYGCCRCRKCWDEDFADSSHSVWSALGVAKSEYASALSQLHSSNEVDVRILTAATQRLLHVSEVGMPFASVATCLLTRLPWMPSMIACSNPAQQPATFKRFVFCSIFSAFAALATIFCIVSIAHVVDLTLPGFWS